MFVNIAIYQLRSFFVREPVDNRNNANKYEVIYEKKRSPSRRR
jgi:hypothetical protein